MVWIICSPKTFESEMIYAFRFLRVDVRSQVLPPDFGFVPSVTSRLYRDEFDVLVKIP